MNSRELPCLCSKMKADALQPKHQRNRPGVSTEKQKGPRVSAVLISSFTPLENLDFPWSDIIMWEQRLTEPWPTWPWMRIQIDFFFSSSHKQTGTPLAYQAALKANGEHHTPPPISTKYAIWVKGVQLMYSVNAKYWLSDVIQANRNLHL